MAQDISKSSVPLAWLVAAVITVGGGFYWMADLNARVNSMEDVVRELVQQAAINGNRLTRIETMLEGLSSDVARVVIAIEQGKDKPVPDRDLSR